ncbi:sel1 repeat family protein [Oxalobacter vibrioformis]|uniref:Sel1 repeat family protein n=1 Tax=Oxalobacter vibrioformis TaxID=933080 RepID=A0A9E9LYJ6_9BURK|nr:tetratricopeptide repeat protein [Oxalobacter vibrioformis]WAW09862.1 sel1 repeat family protein [Oxalobacter vibrioformis]
MGFVSSLKPAIEQVFLWRPGLWLVEEKWRWLHGKMRYACRSGQGRGYAKSNGRLANLSVRGMFVAHDDGKAYEWAKKGADAGDAYSQSLMGYLTLYGKGVEKNYGEARKWLRMASDKGDAFAQYRLGLIYETGAGFMAPDAEKAAHWYAVSEENGNKDARNRLRELRKKTGG